MAVPFVVPDQSNNVVRAINSSGVITSLDYSNITSSDAVWNSNLGFQTPITVNVDPSGNLYIGDTGAAVIYKLTPSLVLTRVAGDGSIGSFSAGPALSTSFRAIVSFYCAFDSAGNLYISGIQDVYAVNMQATTQTILGVSIASGEIAIVAGIENVAGYDGDAGPATSAHLQDPQAIALDNAGNLYIATQGSQLGVQAGGVIRKVATDGTISSFAGNASDLCTGDGGLPLSAGLGQCTGISIDAAGNLYISSAISYFSPDPQAGNVRVINMQGTTQTILGISVAAGIIQTVAGAADSSTGFSGDGSAATSALLAPGPWMSRVDSQGNLYIADSGNERVRLVDPSGIINTVAGNGATGYTGDGGPATEATFGNAGFNDVVAWPLVAPTGKIVIQKSTVPGGSPQSFTFTSSYGAPFTLTDGQSNDSGPLAPGTYSVVETSVTGWATTTSSDPSNIVVTAGNTTTVTFTNTISNIVIQKATVPAGSGQVFTFTPSYGAPFTLTDGQSNDSGALAPGTYSVAETPVTGWTTVTSSDPTAIVVTAGNTTTVTFTNTAPGTIVVAKATVPSGSQQSFSFTSDYGSPFDLLDGQSNNSGPLVAGTYSVTEAPVAGWTTTTSQDPTAIVVAPGSATTIIFTNTVIPGNIITSKIMAPPSTQRFTFTPSWGPAFTLGNGETNDSGPIAAGTYNISEIPVDGWITTATPNPANLTVADGQTTTVTFTNTSSISGPPPTCDTPISTLAENVLNRLEEKFTVS